MMGAMRGHRRRVILLAVVTSIVASGLLPGLLPCRAEADIIGLPVVSRQTFSFGFDMSTWSIDVPTIDRYTQMVFPMAYAVPFGSRLSLDVAARPFRSTISPAVGSTDAVTHFGDTLVRASYRLGRDFGMVVVSVGAPTGLAQLDSTEVANAIFAADRRFNNPVTTFGTGLVVNGSFAMAQPVGKWALGAGVAYSYRAKYDLSDIVTDYDPGDEINVTGGIDRNFIAGGRPAQITADVVYTHYLEDQQAGQTVFELGDRLIVEGRGLFATGFIDPWILSVTYRSRANSIVPGQNELQHGGRLDLLVTSRIPANEKLAFDISAQARLFADDEDATGATMGDASIFGIGLGLRGWVTRSTMLQPAVLFEFGEMDGVSVSGIRFQAGVTIRP